MIQSFDQLGVFPQFSLNYHDDYNKFYFTSSLHIHTLVCFLCIYFSLSFLHLCLFFLSFFFCISVLMSFINIGKFQSFFLFSFSFSSQNPFIRHILNCLFLFYRSQSLYICLGYLILCIKQFQI